MSDAREVRLFRNGRNQAVRIPRDLELPGKVAVMRREGQRLVIESPPPAGPNASLLSYLATATPLDLDDAFPDIDDVSPGPVEI